jgi:replication factor A1
MVMPENQIIQKIIDSTGLDRAEIERRVTDKQQELSGLVSKEGAAYIVAKELGLDLFQRVKRRLEIRNIAPGIKNLNLTARVYRIFEPREFEIDGKKSAVANILLADQTGIVRLSLWDRQINLLSELKPGLAVEVFRAYTKADNRGEIEIRLSKRGGLKVLEESELPPLSELRTSPPEPKREKIAALREGGFYELMAAVVQIFDTEPFYEICPSCGIRVRRGPDGFMCGQHGVVQPAFGIVLSGVIDDGSGNIRAVFFGDAALALAGLDMSEALAQRAKLLENLDVLGKEFVMRGRVRKNKIFDRLEFVANMVRPAEARAEAARLMKQLRGQKL